MELLGELFTQMVCKECGNSCLVLEDEPRERKGSASHLRVRCKDCGWVYTFYTSKKVQHSFDINRRFVYAMRSIGQGHASMKRFCSYMNMPPPLHYKAYNASNAALSKAATSVAMKTMEDAANELHEENCNSITKCGVSCDGTWQRRGYSSLNGCVTTLSIDTGKCLDVEIMTKVCHGCQRIDKQTDALKKADMLVDISARQTIKDQRHLWKQKGSRGYLEGARRHVSCNIQSTLGMVTAKRIMKWKMLMKTYMWKRRNVSVMSRSELGRHYGN